MIQNLKFMTIYPQIQDDTTGEIMEDTIEYFGPTYLKASLEYGYNSPYVKELYNAIANLGDFPDIPVGYSENLSGGELNSLRNFLINLLTISISITRDLTNTMNLKPLYQPSSVIVPDTNSNEYLSITAIKHGYLYLEFILENYKINNDSDFLNELELAFISALDGEFPYDSRDIFLRHNGKCSYLTTIWSPKEI